MESTLPRLPFGTDTFSQLTLTFTLTRTRLPARTYTSASVPSSTTLPALPYSRAGKTSTTSTLLNPRQDPVPTDRWEGPIGLNSISRPPTRSRKTCAGDIRSFDKLQIPSSCLLPPAFCLSTSLLGPNICIADAEARHSLTGRRHSSLSYGQQNILRKTPDLAYGSTP